jgi:hypothetical protein
MQPFLSQVRIHPRAVAGSVAKTIAQRNVDFRDFDQADLIALGKGIQPMQLLPAIPERLAFQNSGCYLEEFVGQKS